MVHIGADLEDGHFVTYVRCDETWYHCNDSVVEPLSGIPLDDLKRDAYVAVYDRGDQPPFRRVESGTDDSHGLGPEDVVPVDGLFGSRVPPAMDDLLAFAQRAGSEAVTLKQATAAAGNQVVKASLLELRGIEDRRHNELCKLSVREREADAAVEKVMAAEDKIMSTNVSRRVQHEVEEAMASDRALREAEAAFGGASADLRGLEAKLFRLHNDEAAGSAAEIHRTEASIQQARTEKRMMRNAVDDAQRRRADAASAVKSAAAADKAKTKAVMQERARARQHASFNRKHARDQNNGSYGELSTSMKRSCDLLNVECKQIASHAYEQRLNSDSPAPKGPTSCDVLAAKGGPLRHAVGTVRENKAIALAIVQQPAWHCNMSQNPCATTRMS